MWEIGGIM